MGNSDKEEYRPEVYRRLELVRRQFKTQAEEDRRQRRAEKLRDVKAGLRVNRIKIARFTIYGVLALLVLAVILVLVLDKLQ
jgi:Flp pilus assembly protein TadB